MSIPISWAILGVNSPIGNTTTVRIVKLSPQLRFSDYRSKSVFYVSLKKGSHYWPPLLDTSDRLKMTFKLAKNHPYLFNYTGKILRKGRNCV